MPSFKMGSSDLVYEVHQKGTTSHILWYSDWLHYATSAGSSFI